MTPRIILGLIVLVLAATGCSTRSPVPELGSLYSRSARYHGPDRNPVIVIPGILGSRLKDSETGTVVWGAFAGAFADPADPQGARLCALPMKEGAPLADLRDGVVAAGALDRLTISIVGLPIELNAYANILQTLGVGGYRDDQIAYEVDYGDDHFTCFQFDYDWRRSNVENAKRLHEFIIEKRSYVEAELARRYGPGAREIKFDIVAHSMGGLIARYFLRYGSAPLPEDGSPPDITWEGSRLVDQVILVGTPNAGSAQAIKELVHGMQKAPILPKYESALLGTMPAIFELMPRPRHGALVGAGDAKEKVDFYDPAFWMEMEWGLADPDQDRVLQVLLPGVGKAEDRRRIALDQLRKALSHTKQFHASLDVPADPPAHVRVSLISGDAMPTDRVLVADRRTGGLSVLDRAPGDGIVPRSSALMDERVGGRWTPALVSPIAWRHVMFVFTGHLAMTMDPAFADNILYMLLEEPAGD